MAEYLITKQARVFMRESRREELLRAIFGDRDDKFVYCMARAGVNFGSGIEDSPIELQNDIITHVSQQVGRLERIKSAWQVH